MVVHAEDHPNRCILETRISREDGFQKQQGMSSFSDNPGPYPKKNSPRLDARSSANINPKSETLIVWTEPQSGLDMALSFQEADGCAMIWYVTCTDSVPLPRSSHH